MIYKHRLQLRKGDVLFRNNGELCKIKEIEIYTVSDSQYKLYSFFGFSVIPNGMVSHFRNDGGGYFEVADDKDIEEYRKDIPEFTRANLFRETPGLIIQQKRMDM